MDGTDLRFETMEHGGEYPDTMPQSLHRTDRSPFGAFCPTRFTRLEIPGPQGRHPRPQPD